MSQLTARGLRANFGAQDVLHAVDVDVDAHTRLGLVGPNGAGKSTLLRLLVGHTTPDAGDVVRTGTVGLLPQEPDRRPGETLGAYLHRRTGLADADEALEAATTQLGSGSDSAHDAYEEALERWMSLGGADFDSRAERTLDRLGLDPAILATPTTGLSGGQMARGSLAAVLLSRYDVLLLDEPTNDLDLTALEILEEFVVQSTHIGMVLVSHDREFLARTVTDVLELDPVNSTWSAFAGGWEAYRTEREVARQRMRGAFEDVEKQRAHLVAQVQGAKEQSVRGALRARKSPSDGDKVAKGSRVEAATSGAKKVRALESRLGQLDRRLEDGGIVEPRKEWELRIELPEAPRSGDVVATVRDAVVHKGEFTLGPVDLDVRRGDRIVIVGPNGAGKSTLLRLLLGREQPDEGSVSLGQGVVVGELDQAREWLDSDQTVTELLSDRSGLSPVDARTLLAKFGLKGPRVARPARAMSPGERTRALLALLMAAGTNLLVLDEPTNHLDLPAIEQLEEALGAYSATLLLVSHDRRLLDEVEVDHRWVVDDGSVRVELVR